jgi:hypothetical protein
MAIIVCNVYQLGIMNGQVDTENKKLIRSGAKVEESYAKQVNDNYKDTMKLYEKDNKASADYKKRSEIFNQIEEEYRKDRKPVPGADKINKEVERRMKAPKTSSKEDSKQTQTKSQTKKKTDK